MMRAATLARPVTVAALLLLAAVLGLHLALLPLGRWNPDEYFYFAVLRHYGILFIPGRLLTWSPRPLSELLLFGYARLVDWAGRPLIAPALLFAWGTLAAGALLGALAGRDRGGRMARLLLAAAVLALFLLGHPVMEMFYWPAAALAYLPALGAVTLIALRVVLGTLEEAGGQRAAVAALLVATASVEVGAMFAASFAALMLLRALLSAPRRPRVLAGWALALACAAGVLLVLAHGRGGLMREQLAATPLLHHPGASLRAALAQTARQLVLPAALPLSRLALGQSLLTLALLFLGARCCLRAAAAAVPRGPMVLLALALPGTMLLSAAAADYQFGTLCCERHDTFRAALVVLLVVTLAALSLPARARPAAGPAVRLAGPLLLALAVAVPFASRAPDLAVEYGARSARAAARAATWTSGRAPGAAPLVFVMAPAGPLFSYSFFPPGRYVRDDRLPWTLAGPLMFFDKPEMQVVQAPLPP